MTSIAEIRDQELTHLILLCSIASVIILFFGAFFAWGLKFNFVAELLLMIAFGMCVFYLVISLISYHLTEINKLRALEKIQEKLR